MEGTFGIILNDGRRFEGNAGDLLVIPRGTTLTYFGTNAKLFFVVTPTAEVPDAGTISGS